MVVNDDNLEDSLHLETMVPSILSKYSTIPSMHETLPVSLIQAIFSTTVVPMDSTATLRNRNTTYRPQISINLKRYEEQCKLYGLRWLGNNTCYKELFNPDRFLFGDYNKTNAIKMCKITNATLPRVSAWEFFGHKVRESAGKRLIFCMLVEMLVTHNI